MVMAPAKPGQGQAPQPTWLTEAQIRHQPVSQIAYDAGLGVVRFLVLPQAGYLSALQLVTTLTGTLNQAPTQIDPEAYINGGLQQIRVFINTEGEMYNLDGFMGGIAGAIDDFYNNGDAKIYNTPQAQFAFNPSTNAFTNVYLHRVPLALRLRNLPYPLGLYNTALQNLQTQIQVRFLPLAGVTGVVPGTGAAYQGSGLTQSTVSGNVDVNEEYFEPIPLLSAQPPLRYIHRWTQFEVPINVSNGVVDVPLPGRQRYLRMIYAVIDGASASTLTLNDNIMTNLQLTYGVQSHPEDETTNQVKTRMRKQYGKLMDTMPGGVYTHDFVSMTKDARDWFNAGLVTNLRAQLTFAGAHTGVGSKIVCATEELLTLRAAGFNQTAAVMAGAQP